MLFKGAKKEDLRLIALKINLNIDEKNDYSNDYSNILFSITYIIENSEMFKNKQDLVKEIADSINENRKQEEQKLVELEQINLERSKNELELARLKAETKLYCVSKIETKSDLLDQLIKSIRTLTVNKFEK